MCKTQSVAKWVKIKVADSRSKTELTSIELIINSISTCMNEFSHLLAKSITFKKQRGRARSVARRLGFEVKDELTG